MLKNGQSINSGVHILKKINRCNRGSLEWKMNDTAGCRDNLLFFTISNWNPLKGCHYKGSLITQKILFNFFFFSSCQCASFPPCDACRVKRRWWQCDWGKLTVWLRWLNSGRRSLNLRFRCVCSCTSVSVWVHPWINIWICGLSQLSDQCINQSEFSFNLVCLKFDF